MQTFLPYPEFDRSARVLDPSRLGNQVYRECKTLISGGWPNHPASKMWRGYESALALYSLACLRELECRGRSYPHHITFFAQFVTNQSMPPWLGDPDFHRSHRSNLTRKDPKWYGQFWDEPNDLPYVWPVR